MTLAFCLAFYGLLAGVGAPKAMGQASRFVYLPRLGVAVWFAALAGVVVSLTFAAALVVASAVHAVDVHCGPMQACVPALNGLGSQSAGQIAVAFAGLAAAVAAGFVLHLSWVVTRSLSSAWRAHHRHAAMLRMIGRPAPELGRGALLVDTAERAAYCVGGRCRTIVVTRGALGVLARHELAAVLAHERAHLAGKHHLLLALVRAVRQAMPWLPLARVAEAEMARLLEMCADDAAVRGHGRRSLLAALAAMTAGPAPHGALGATGTAVLDRANRLVEWPPESRLAASRRALACSLTALVLGPLAVLVAMVLTSCAPALR
ncbi:MAG: M56 family metallopeptidase [Pseudonocardiaceae bacterium]